MNKLYCIIITKIDEEGKRSLIEYIKLSHPVKTFVKDFNNAQFIGNGIGFSSYADKLVLVDPINISDFFEKDIKGITADIISMFPKSVITALMLNSIIDGFGYAIVSEGKRQRVRYGMFDEIFLDEGSALDVENLEKEPWDTVEDILDSYGISDLSFQIFE